MKSLIVILVAAMVVLGGCSANNRNFCSSVSTVIGIRADFREDVQLPVIRLGFAKSVILLLPTQLNVAPPAIDDASKCVPIFAKTDISVGFMSGVKISERFIINPSPSMESDSAIARALLEAPVAKFLEKQ